MIPFILAAIGGAFIGHAISPQGEKFKYGGSVPNNYEGKTAEEIWDAWNEKQRLHFLNDHNKQLSSSHRMKQAVVDELCKIKYNQLGMMPASWLQQHINEGQYSNGGDIPNNYEDKTADEVWNEWTLEQKTNFLKDHWWSKPDVLLTSSIKDIEKSNYADLPAAIKHELISHTKHGEYKKGGDIDNYTDKLITPYLLECKENNELKYYIVAAEGGHHKGNTGKYVQMGWLFTKDLELAKKYASLTDEQRAAIYKQVSRDKDVTDRLVSNSGDKLFWKYINKNNYKAGGDVPSDKIAKVLIISSKNPLSTQLYKETGDSWNAIDYEEEHIDRYVSVIRHKDSGKTFIVFSQNYYSQVDDNVIKNDLDYVVKYKIFSIEGYEKADGKKFSDGGGIPEGLIDVSNLEDWELQNKLNTLIAEKGIGNYDDNSNKVAFSLMYEINKRQGEQLGGGKNVCIRSTGKGVFKTWHILDATSPYSYVSEVEFDTEEEAEKYATYRGHNVVEKFEQESDDDTDNKDYEMVVVYKELDKDGGKKSWDRYFVNTNSIEEAKEKASKLWEDTWSDSDLTFIEALTDEEYREKYLKMAKGGKTWIQDAIKNKGALRETAKRKGLIRGDEKLSMTDIKKLEKVGGKTAKRAHLAETLGNISKKHNPHHDKLKKVMAHAKSTRKDGEAWKEAVARSWKEVE